MIDFVPQGSFGDVRNIFDGHICEGATGNQWVEAREAAEHPARHGTAPPRGVTRLQMSLCSALGAA